MSADINAKDLLFKGKLHLFIIFADIRIGNPKLLLRLLRHNIEQAHLTCHIVLRCVCLLFHHADVNAHHLLPGYAEAVECTGLDQAFHDAAVDGKAGRAADEVL